MKKMLGLLLVMIVTVGAVGCESAEDREIRVTEAVKNNYEALVGDNEAYSQMTNKEWSYVKKDDGQEIVTLTGTLTYVVSVNVSYQFYIDDGYIVKLVYSCLNDSTTWNLPKNDKSKLDI